MRTWIFSGLMFLVLAGTVHAEDWKEQDVKSVGQPSRIESAASMKVSDLESRIRELEREKRFQDDRIRSLERSVDELRRKI